MLQYTYVFILKNKWKLGKKIIQVPYIAQLLIDSENSMEVMELGTLDFKHCFV